MKRAFEHSSVAGVTWRPLGGARLLMGVLRTAPGSRWYTSPPSPSARSERRILDTLVLGQEPAIGLYPVGFLNLDLRREHTWRVPINGRSRVAESGALVVLNLDGQDAPNGGWVFRGGGGPESPVLTNDRIFHGVALFLLKGGIRVVGSPFEPDGQGTVVSELAPVVPSRTIFRPFSDSFKNFKQHYFKIIVDKAGLREFSDGEGRPLFPFYWTRDPRRIGANSIGDLTARDLEAVRTISTLPRRISARHLVECLSLEDCGPKAFELMTTLGPRKSNFLTIRKKSGASSSTARPTSVPKVPRPPPAGASSGRVPPTDKAVGLGAKVSGSSLPPELAAVQVGPTSGAAMTSADPTRKRKDPTAEGRKDKEGSSSRSASKKARKDKGKEKDRERVLAVPLPGGVFSPDFSMSDRTKFHMSSSQRALIEPLSELELTNAMLEMSTRTSALAWYLRNFADRPGVAEVRAELDREKKNAACLQVTLEEMVLNQDEYDKWIEQLEADLEKAKRESAEGLAAARIEQERLAEESRQKIELLEAEVTRIKEAESCRAKANEELTLEVAKAKEQVAELESTILFEHEEGFNKALRQVTLFAGVQDPFALGVDIEKDVFNGVLVDLNAAEENEPTAEAAAGGKN
ncbi:hypothetical protein LR48_Vigan05g123900 [Vigna angularis]|uniref:Uncharacterized protein n=1 Tax=Phaseolus angularis TaxID=3914 RepID=A0A0L9UM64_PHAAN|nr:hypothetical protein LR48_Vigan05g123900 [Vigna angularis]